MKKRLSIIASGVILGAILTTGCGGGGTCCSGDELPSLGKDDSATGTAKIVADSTGNTNTKVSLVSEKGNQVVAVATITTVSDANGDAACTKASDDCGVTAHQISACGIDSSAAAFVEAKKHVVALENSSSRYDPETDMVVFGGTLKVDGVGFDKCTMALAINMIPCGSAFKTDGTSTQAGFANENHIVDVFVEEDDGDSYWIRDIKVQDGKIIIPAGKLSNIDLPAKFTFYSIKDSNKDSTTGVTGGTGGY